jgi:hypothetical protein
MGKLEPLDTVCGNVKWYKHSGTRFLKRLKVLKLKLFKD